MKIFNKTIVILMALCLTMQVFAQETINYLSLNQACKIGIKNNIEVTNARLETKKSLYQLHEVKSKLYPQLEAYSNLNYYYGIPKMQMPGEMFGTTGEVAVQIGTKYDWSNGFQASLILYNLNYFTSIKIAKKMQGMNDLNLQQKKENLVYQISQIYFLCKTTENQIVYLGKNRQNTDHLLEILKRQNESGVARKIDYSKVIVNKNNLQTQIDNLTQLLEQQLGFLKFIIGVNPTSTISLSDSLSISQDLQNMELPDLNYRTEMKLLDKQMEISSLNRKANQQSYLPTLSSVGQYFYQGQQNSFNFFKSAGGDKFFKVGYVGLNLSVPIFDGFGKHAKNKQYEIEQQQLFNTSKNTFDNLTKDFIDAIKQYKNSENAIRRQEENIKIAEQDYSITLQGYHQQVVLLSDLMLSENALTEARLSYVNALLQLKNAELEVRKLKGELLKY